MLNRIKTLIEYHQGRADKYKASAKTAWTDGLYMDEKTYLDRARRHNDHIETIRALVDAGKKGEE